MLCMLLLFPLAILAVKKWQDKDFVGLEMLYTYDGHAQQTVIKDEEDEEQTSFLAPVEDSEERELLTEIITEEPHREFESSIINLPRPPPSPSPSTDSGVAEMTNGSPSISRSNSNEVNNFLSPPPNVVFSQNGQNIQRHHDMGTKTYVWPTSRNQETEPSVRGARNEEFRPQEKVASAISVLGLRPNISTMSLEEALGDSVGLSPTVSPCPSTVSSVMNFDQSDVWSNVDLR